MVLPLLQNPMTPKVSVIEDPAGKAVSHSEVRRHEKLSNGKWVGRDSIASPAYNSAAAIRDDCHLPAKGRTSPMQNLLNTHPA